MAQLIAKAVKLLKNNPFQEKH